MTEMTVNTLKTFAKQKGVRFALCGQRKTKKEVLSMLKKFKLDQFVWLEVEVNGFGNLIDIKGVKK